MPALIDSQIPAQGVWTKGEDALLETYVSRHGPSWAVISQKMVQRSADRTYILPEARWFELIDEDLRMLQTLETLPRSKSRSLHFLKSGSMYPRSTSLIRHLTNTLDTNRTLPCFLRCKLTVLGGPTSRDCISHYEVQTA